MPGSVHHSAVRKSSQLVATMVIHMADLIAVQDRSLSSVMLENRSCSWSCYLRDGCWQLTHFLPFFSLLAFNILFFCSAPLLHCHCSFLLYTARTPTLYSAPLYVPSLFPLSRLLPSIRPTISSFPPRPPSIHFLGLISLPCLTFHSNSVAFPSSNTCNCRCPIFRR